MPDSNPYSSPSSNLQSQPKNPAIGILRVILWLSPGPAFLLGVAALPLVGLARFFATNPNFFLIPLAIICPAAIGYFDAILSKKVPKQDGFPLAKPAIRHVIIFTLLQILLAPCILFAMLLGFCAYAGG